LQPVNYGRLDSILIVYSIAVIHQESVAIGVTLAAVKMSFAFPKLAKEPQAEFPSLFLLNFFM
jgi:hypothetical protein